MNRRNFIHNTAFAAISTSGVTKVPFMSEKEEKDSTLRFGICADLHQDLIWDAPRRLSAFMDDMLVKKPDFIIQMGDFCHPKETNKIIMQIWNRFSGPKHHVIGNHDLESQRFTRKQVLDFWEARDPYYSFDIKGYHIIILDGNERNPEHEIPWKYERYISEEQLNWLENDLNQTDLPVIVFIHQGLDGDLGGIEEAVRTRQVFSRANEKAKFRKVQVVFSGHHHKDYHNVINGIHYIHINSASYHWQGDKYAESPYSEELNKQFPYMKYMAHYKDPLWAVVDIVNKETLSLTGKKSVFLGKSPIELGMPPYKFAYPIVPTISDRVIKLSREL